ASLLGHWTLLYPGYTSCPDVCPTTLAMLKALDANLAKSGHKLSVVFLSIDPARDTPVRLATYVHFFNPDFTGVTAQEPALAQFTRMLGIAYLKVPGKTPETYEMDHSSGLILFDPQARYTAFFSAPQKLEVLAADLAALMDARS
ncbi:MAG: SCO family protein, partial [Stenotrophobium sp.]